VDSYTPPEIAHLVEAKGVAKAQAAAIKTFALAVLAGGFIGLGGVFATVAGTSTGLGFGVTRLLMGMAFSLGLVLVVVAGAELFTGNNLIVMSWVSRRITARVLLQHWGVVYLGNLVGAIAIAGLVYLADWWKQDNFAVGATALSIAQAKSSSSFAEIFFRGILANVLVCLAVWLAFAGRSVVDKAVAIVFPVTAFVAAGFEHSVANMYFLPLGLMLRGNDSVVTAAGLDGHLSHVTLGWTVHNLAAATLGNIIGGAVLVGLVYWFIYLRDRGQGEQY
jgi:formate transporter